jgi:hypothetical protein
MEVNTRKWMQAVLAVFIVAALVRVGLIYRERHQAEQTKEAGPQRVLKGDDFVYVRPSHVSDLESANRNLKDKTVWVKSGYVHTYYPAKGNHADFGHEAGVLAPMDKLTLTGFWLQTAPGGGHTVRLDANTVAHVNDNQVMGGFHREGERRDYAVPAGIKQGGEYSMRLDDMFFFEDPHELYKHWPKDFWQAIAQHEAKPGMSETAVSLALGVGGNDGEGSYGNRTLSYPNNGKPVQVTFVGNEAKTIEAVNTK